MIKEILPGIYNWSEYSEEKKLNFNGYLLINSGESVIVDPPSLSVEDEVKLTRLIGDYSSSSLKGILLTNVHHERASNSLKSQFSVPVWVNELDSALLELPADNTFSGGDTLFGGVEAIQLENQKSPGETAFYIKDRKIMLLGDALIGTVPGQVNMLPPDKFKDPAEAKLGLKKLLNFEFETLLLGDGASILTEAKGAVATFLS